LNVTFGSLGDTKNRCHIPGDTGTLSLENAQYFPISDDRIAEVLCDGQAVIREENEPEYSMVFPL